MNKAELEKEAIKCMHEIKYWLRVPIKKETEKDGISEILKLTEPREKRIAELEAEKKDLTIKIDRLESACDAYNYSQRTYQEEIKELEAQIERMKCCENCVFFKDKKYDICHRIKKLGTRKCAFYKMV